MNDPLEHNDFEKRLKKAAEDFSPKPSGRVWESLRDELHPRRRTYTLGAAAAVLLLLAVGVYFLQKEYSSPSLKPSVTEQMPPSASPQTSPAQSNSKNQSDEQGNKGTPPSTLSDGLSAKAQRHKERYLHENNTPAPSAQTTMLRRHNQQNPKPFAINEEGEQVSDSKIGNQIAEGPGLPFLNNLPLRPFSLSSGHYAEAAPLGYDNYLNNLSSVHNQGQEDADLHEKGKSPPEKLHRGIAFKIFYAPGMGYRTLTKGSPGMMPANSSFYLNQSNSLSSALSNLKQQPAWSWSAGAGITFPLGKAWSLQTGISVSQINYGITAYGTYPGYIRNNNSYYAASPARSFSFLSTNALTAARPPVSHLHNSYLMGEIPSLINKEFGNPHRVVIRIGAGAGLSYLFHSSPVIYSPSSGRYFTGSYYIRNLNGDLHIETSLLIPLTDQLKIDIGPSFQYQILSSYKNYPAIKEHPYFLGLKTGLQWGR